MTENVKKKIDNITVLTYENDELLTINPKALKGRNILVTTDFIDRFSHYESPFKDSLDFAELIHKYIRNRWQDHYS